MSTFFINIKHYDRVMVFDCIVSNGDLCIDNGWLETAAGTHIRDFTSREMDNLSNDESILQAAHEGLYEYQRDRIEDMILDGGYAL